MSYNLVVIDSSNYCVSEKYHLAFLKKNKTKQTVFPGYRILGWHFFCLFLFIQFFGNISSIVFWLLWVFFFKVKLWCHSYFFYTCAVCLFFSSFLQDFCYYHSCSAIWLWCTFMWFFMFLLLRIFNLVLCIYSFHKIWNYFNCYFFKYYPSISLKYQLYIC